MIVPNILIDPLPKSVVIDGVEHVIGYGFRTLMLIEQSTFDESLSDEQITLNVLNLFYCNEVPDNTKAALEYFLWFYRCGEEREETGGVGYSSAVRCYDFTQDQRLIYAAFMGQYHIDLQDTNSKDLHWWKFKAMFDALDENCKLCKIMGYRLMDLKGMKGEQRKFYAKMKKIYALRQTVSPDKVIDHKLRLEERNRRMREYVNHRFEESCTGATE